MIREWIKDVITGVGGLHDYEKYELSMHDGADHEKRDQDVAVWVLRCLGNPNCEGSGAVLQEIIDHRKKVIDELGYQKAND